MSVSRREFLALSAMTVWPAAVLQAIEPVKRQGPAVLRLSLAAYSLRDELTGKTKEGPVNDLFTFVDYCKSLGLEGTELTSYYFPNDVTPAYLRELKAQVAKQGLVVSGGAIRNDFCQKPGPKLDTDLEHTRQWIDHYTALATTKAIPIRLFGGNVPKGSTETEAIDRCIACFNKACEWAEGKRVILALENHGGITANPEAMLEIARGVQSPYFGVNLDTGNFHLDDPYAALEKILPYAVNVQVKVDMKYQNKTEPADFGRLIKMLKANGYSGWVALEYENKQVPPYKAIPMHIVALRKLVKER